MEYDRALYRVYERMMEDLMTTSSIFQSTTSIDSARGPTAGNGNGNGNGEGGGQEEDDDIWMEQDQISANSGVENVIPFLWPIFMTKYMMACERLYDGGWREFYQTVSRTRPTVSSCMNLPCRYLTRIRRTRRRNNNGTFMRILGQEDDARGRDHAGDGFEDNPFDNDGATGVNDVEMAVMSSRNMQNLRRRNPSSDSSSGSEDSGASLRSTSTASSGGNYANNRLAMIPQTTIVDRNNSDSEESALGYRSVSRYEGNGESLPRETPIDTNVSVTPTTRIAQEIASRHQERNQGQQQQQDGTSTADADTTLVEPAASRQRRIQERDERRGGCTQKGLHKIMRICLFVAIFHLFVLGCLHRTYVGPRISKRMHILANREGMDDTTRSSATRDLKRKDDVWRTCLENALATRPAENRSRFFALYGESVKEDEENEDHHENENLTNATSDGREPPLLGRDELLQIKIIYGDDCKNCSKVRTVVARNETIANVTTGYLRSRFLSQSKITRSDEGERSLTENNDDRFSTYTYWDTNVYRFSTNEALMYLDEKMLLWHNVSIVNVTLSERCLATGSDNGDYNSIKKVGKFMSTIYGMDSIIINQLMYSIKTSTGKNRGGHVKNMETKERWMYTKTQLDDEYDARHNLITWLFNRIGVLIVSLVAFFLVTSVTSVIVRLLTSSGVMIMFPIFSCLRGLGVAINQRVLEMSYPWIGQARRAIRRQRVHPFNHYLGAKLGKLFLMYTLYESSQVAWSSIFYSKSTPANLSLWIFGNAMVFEYFNMIFVRSALSAYFYPRLTLLYFLAYHIYFYSVPYGFFDVALIPWIFLMAHNMLFTLLALELPASSRGAVSIESPREVFAKLSWPQWNAAIPADWTLFLPLNSRYIPIHDRNNDAQT